MFKEGMFLKIKPELLEKTWFKRFKETDILLTYRNDHGELYVKCLLCEEKRISVITKEDDHSDEFYEYAFIEYEDVVNGV